MSELRFRVVETAFRKRPAHVEIPSERPSEYFARYVFNKEKMFKYLPGGVYAKLVDVIENNVPLDSGIADEVGRGDGSYPLYSLVSSADGRNGGKA